MLKIGISSCFAYPDPSRIVFAPKQLGYLEKDMGQFIAQKEVLPLLIPDLEDALLYSFIDQLDGIVLQGGSDISPLTYGEKPIENGRWLGDPYRDAYELKIIDYAIKKDVPIWGICRGFQLLNVYFGGTLYQDITTQNPTALSHRDAILYDQHIHAVQWEEDSFLSQLYKTTHGTVNSIHHQGIKTLASCLLPMAFSSQDGIIEAFRHAEKPHIMGVQWHPEFFYNYQGTETLLDAKVLYQYFLEHI